MNFPAFHGVLRHNPTNPRYFTNDTGKAIYFTGSHTWATWVDLKRENDPPFDWAWKSFLRGHNVLLMDPWGPVLGRTRKGYAGAILNVRDYPTYEPLRVALGQTRRFVQRLDLNAALPRPEFASSRYCLANPGHEYLVYLPDDDRVNVYLGIEPKSYRVEWFDTRSGETLVGDAVQGGGNRHFTSPFGLESVLYLRSE